VTKKNAKVNKNKGASKETNSKQTAKYKGSSLFLRKVNRLINREMIMYSLSVYTRQKLQRGWSLHQMVDGFCTGQLSQ